MERKLAEYRANKAKEQKPKDNNTDKTSSETDENNVKIWSSNNSSSNTVELGTVGRLFASLYTVSFLMKFALWFSLWMFFLKIEFGAVYFVVSLTLILYYSMKHNQRKDDEPSAYSVFNKNFEKLEGTFTAEQFENQMIYGGASRK